MSKITLEMVYEEIKTIRRLLEELVERSLENILPTEKIFEEEMKELEEIKEKREYVPLSEVKKNLTWSRVLVPRYKILISKKALKLLEKLDIKRRLEIIKEIENLEIIPSLLSRML